MKSHERRFTRADREILDEKIKGESRANLKRIQGGESRRNLGSEFQRIPAKSASEYRLKNLKKKSRKNLIFSRKKSAATGFGRAVSGLARASWIRLPSWIHSAWIRSASSWIGSMKKPPVFFPGVLPGSVRRSSYRRNIPVVVYRRDFPPVDGSGRGGVFRLRVNFACCHVGPIHAAPIMDLLTVEKLQLMRV